MLNKSDKKYLNMKGSGDIDDPAKPRPRTPALSPADQRSKENALKYLEESKEGIKKLPKDATPQEKNAAKYRLKHSTEKATKYNK